MTKPADTDREVYVVVSRELLPKLKEWSEPVRVRIDSEEGSVLVLRFERVEQGA